jgi:uncharacterized protein (DUF433 family)
MAMANSSATYAHITFPDNGGEPRIDGLRLRVRDIAVARADGMTPEQIVSEVYPFLTLGQVYAALAYYEDHREEIDGFHKRDLEIMEEFKRRNPDSVIDHRFSNE